MAQTAKQPRELKNVGYEIFIGLLSILSILNLILSAVFRDSQALQYVVLIMNAFFMPIFLADFCYRFFTAPSKSGYFFRNFGWADLLSSLPFARTKILRLFRLWRVIRLMRNFGLRNLVHEFVADRAGNALLTVVFLVFCVLEFGSLAVLSAELSSPDANITNASDATLVDLCDDHDCRLWRQIPGDQCRPAGRRPGHDGRRGSVRHPQRFPGQHFLVAAQEERGAGGDLRPMPTTPRLSSPSSSG